MDLPLFLPASAGFPSPAAEWRESRLNITDLLIPHPASIFYVRCAGNSMQQPGRERSAPDQSAAKGFWLFSHRRGRCDVLSHPQLPLDLTQTRLELFSALEHTLSGHPVFPGFP